MAAKTTPSLQKDYQGLQLVDGNNYLLNRFQESHGGLIIRNIVADIRNCVQPPVFVFDHGAGNDRRRKLFPPYKMRSAEEKAGRESLWPMLKLFKTVMPHLPCVTICVPGWEADDVLASIACKQEKPCRLITTDRDLSQLNVSPLIEVTSGYENIPPEWVRLYKTFVGDPADKIPGVPRFGIKAWEDLNKPLAAHLDFQRYCSVDLNMKGSHFAWCYENTELLKTFHTIVGLMMVPDHEVYGNVQAGTNNPEMVNKLLGEFML